MFYLFLHISGVAQNRISIKVLNFLQSFNLKDREAHPCNLYLYKIESRIFVKGVRIVRQCEALHIIYRRIRHDMESNMG